MAQAEKVKWRCLYSWLLVTPPLVLLAYAALILCKTWPIQEFSIAKAGVFGDSFGLINALFSGFAFAGVIITMLLQKEQLGLQLDELIENRKQFERSATAQEETAKLNALSALLIEYSSQLAINEQKQAIRSGNISDGILSRLRSEHETLLQSRNKVVQELENTLDGILQARNKSQETT